nr:pyruvate, phosphate dikinase [Desulfobacterales bacterium]
MIRSKALEVNIADHHVEVKIDSRFEVLQRVMAPYFGLQEGLTTFLKELSHPYKNWLFIVKEARIYSLDYFHLLKGHDDGPDAAWLFADIYLCAIESTGSEEVRADAADNLLLFLIKILKEAGETIERFVPPLDRAFKYLGRCDRRIFALFLKSYYQLNRLGEAVQACAGGDAARFEYLNRLLIRFYQSTYVYWLGEEDPQRWFEKEAGDFKPDAPLEALFDTISHASLKRHTRRLDEILAHENLRSSEVLDALLDLPGFNQIVTSHREVPGKLLAIDPDGGRGNLYRLLFLFYQMNLSGLSIIHEEALRDINRTLTW